MTEKSQEHHRHDVRGRIGNQCLLNNINRRINEDVELTWAVNVGSRLIYSITPFDSVRIRTSERFGGGEG